MHHYIQFNIKKDSDNPEERKAVALNQATTIVARALTGKFLLTETALPPALHEPAIMRYTGEFIFMTIEHWEHIKNMMAAYSIPDQQALSIIEEVETK